MFLSIDVLIHRINYGINYGIISFWLCSKANAQERALKKANEAVNKKNEAVDERKRSFQILSVLSK